MHTGETGEIQNETNVMISLGEKFAIRSSYRFTMPNNSGYAEKRLAGGRDGLRVKGVSKATCRYGLDAWRCFAGGKGVDGLATRLNLGDISCIYHLTHYYQSYRTPLLTIRAWEFRFASDGPV